MSQQDRINPDPFAIYIHIPFCVRKCPYCDFNSRPSDKDERDRYIKALSEEVRLSPFAGTVAQTLFIGGGTPSELTGDELESLVRTVESSFQFETESEWTIECNPGTVNPASCGRLVYLGFNRVSIGVQSFQTEHLETLGRIHGTSDSLDAFRWFRSAGFENINLDLMYGIPGQTLNHWQKDLEQALSLSPEHLSLYCLTIEEGTPFAQLQKKGRFKSVPEDMSADMFELGIELLINAGYTHYEISNFSISGYECLHNLCYWSNAPYLGFGVSASSFVEGNRWTNTRAWEEYINGACGGEVPKTLNERLSPRLALGEEIMLRLRTRYGVSPEALEAKYGIDFEKQFGGEVRFLQENGLIFFEGSNLCLTKRGKLLANEVCTRFLGDGSKGGTELET